MAEYEKAVRDILKTTVVILFDAAKAIMTSGIALSRIATLL